MARTRLDLYQLDPSGGSEGDTIKIVGGVPSWATDSSGLLNSDFKDQVLPSGAIDGVNTSFVLPSAAISPQYIHLYLDGMRLMEGASADYTFNPDRVTITMLYAPATGQNFFADYRI